MNGASRARVCAAQPTAKGRPGA